MNTWLALPAGLAAAGLAYLINRFALGRLGGRAVWLAIPALEESAKTGLALIVGGPVALTHIVFGGVEAIYEVSGRRPSVAAAALALVTHAGLGMLTAAVLLRGRSTIMAVASASAVHALYNLVVAGRPSSSDAAGGEGRAR